MMIDLHCHTTASDGSLSPRELVAMAAAQGVRTLAVTDHDTVDGLPEALAAGAEFGVEVIPGVEFSAECWPGTMHLLGYGFAPDAPSLLEKLTSLRRRRDDRNPKIVARLCELGFDLTMEEVVATAGGKVIGRPHIGHAMVRKGYVASVDEAFKLYLDRGAAAYVRAESIDPADAIDAVRRAGGVAVLAHPYQLRPPDDAALERMVLSLKDAGLEGIEVYYSLHRPEQTAFYRELALRHGLLMTGGSDFHGASKPNITLGIGCGGLRVPPELLPPLKARIAEASALAAATTAS
jgi:predicted metal-dependent phosphoesterase TrpH